MERLVEGTSLPYRDLLHSEECQLHEATAGAGHLTEILGEAHNDLT